MCMKKMREKKGKLCLSSNPTETEENKKSTRMQRTELCMRVAMLFAELLILSLSLSLSRGGLSFELNGTELVLLR